MTYVTIYHNEKGQMIGFNAVDHAGFADSGQDIVCSAISVLLINTINSIEKLTSDQADLVSNEESGLIDYRLKKVPSHEAELLLSAMVIGLKDLAANEEYRDYIQLNFEEV